jgi:hypothetical protein
MLAIVLLLLLLLDLSGRSLSFNAGGTTVGRPRARRPAATSSARVVTGDRDTSQSRSMHPVGSRSRGRP